MKTRPRLLRPLLGIFGCLLFALPQLSAANAAPRTIHATVVALDQPYWYNRLGASQPGGMIFALASDVVDANGQPINIANAKTLAGNVSLRPEKRPRPIVLRVNQGQNLQITFVNLLQPTSAADGVGTRNAGFHVAGLELVNSINSDATYVGANPNAYVAPGSTTTYTYFAKAEGPFYAYSNAADWNGQTAAGLFGTVIVEPAGSEWYRSQVSHDDFAKVASYPGGPGTLPTINYQAAYASGQPVLRMTTPLANGDLQLIYSDLTAIITGPNAGPLQPTGPTDPDYLPNPTYPNRTQPFREFALMYHEIFTSSQAFPQFNNGPLVNVLNAGGDAFAINYGAAGIGAEVLANRLGVGPMGGSQSVDLKFEEFFLSSWANGDPAMIVDVPANADPLPIQPVKTPPVATATPANGPIPGAHATKAFYPDDPSNVYHSYMRDHVTMRVLHTGTQVTHVHHLHAHQWLRSPNDDNSHYLDSQMIAPGSTYTTEIAHNGSGNLNETVGDSIFHCHFYPHFAAGMWGLWRVHDVFESGTVLDTNGVPVVGATIYNRALPDAEIAAGTPIPAVIPLPTMAMAPLPAPVQIVSVPQGGSRALVAPATTTPSLTYANPGYPFFIPGVSGHRAPHPPLDFAPDTTPGTFLDGGLPRHLVLGGNVVRELHTRWDFTKDFIAYDANSNPVAGGLLAFQLPEAGTAVEQAAMAVHASSGVPTVTPDGTSATFAMNGQPAVSGAPFANPTLSVTPPRVYKAAAIQTDVAFTKQGWHYPQQRMISLWDDVQPTLTGSRAPQPFFIRANSGDTVQFWHTNLVPDYYELDDFQVRTPTDIIGQHIHLVKFDVTASDGAGNGFNYEDGSFSPDEVRGRIDAINRLNGLYSFDNSANQFIGTTQTTLTAKAPPASLGTAPAGQNWLGAQTTIQLWGVDPVTNNAGQDRTLRTVFTHDHFGPSTHQQIGLYGGLLVEPNGSTWLDPNTGTQLGVSTTRTDGGPTGWQANIVTTDPAQSYREFALEFGDSQLVYTNQSTGQMARPASPLFYTNFPLPPGTPPPAPLPYTTSAYQVVPGSVPAAVSYAFAINGVVVQPNASITLGAGRGTLFQSFVLHNPVGSSGLTDDYQIAPAVTNGVVTGWNVTALSIAPGWSSPNYAINPPGADTNNQNAGAPYPQMLSPAGSFVMNYRSEPIPARVWNPTAPTPAPATGQQGDLAFAYASINRADALLNVQPTGANGANGFQFPASLTPAATGAVAPQGTDPYTPILNAYVGDRVQIRTLVGSQSNPHFFSMDGVMWLYEPGSANSGYKNNQPMGISEHFEMQFQVPAAATTSQFADYLYNGDAGVDGINGGAWGFLRAFNQSQPSLVALPNNTPPAQTPAPVAIQPPTNATVRSFTIVATTAQQALGANGLVYNNRGQTGGTAGSPLINNPNAVLYFQAGDLTSPDQNGTLQPGHAVEPLILRACAGEWIQITLINAINPSLPQFQSSAAVAATAPYGATVTAPSGQNPIPNIALNLSTTVGLNPQVVGYDITRANGVNVGFNSPATVAAVPAGTTPNQTTFYWYAGSIAVSGGNLVTTPIEFGGINLNPADPLLQHTQGMIGALVIEPTGSTWSEDYNMQPHAAGTPAPANALLTRAAATVTRADGTTFRDFVLITQDDVPLQPTSLGTTQTVNYGTEPMAYRFSSAVATSTDTTAALANSQVGNVDPQTPIFFAEPGAEVRFHMLRPAGGSGDDGETLTLDGHVFQEEPFVANSTALGDNPLSQWFGTRGGHGARDRFEVVIPSAGGSNRVSGDYLYRSTLNGDISNGVWGIFRVGSLASLAVKAPPATTTSVKAAPLLLKLTAETPAATTRPSPIKRLRPATKAPRPVSAVPTSSP